MCITAKIPAPKVIATTLQLFRRSGVVLLMLATVKGLFRQGRGCTEKRKKSWGWLKRRLMRCCGSDHHLGWLNRLEFPRPHNTKALPNRNLFCSETRGLRRHTGRL